MINKLAKTEAIQRKTVTSVQTLIMIAHIHITKTLYFIGRKMAKFITDNRIIIFTVNSKVK